MDTSYEIYKYISAEMASQVKTITIEKDKIFIPAHKQKNPDLYYILDGKVCVFSQSYNGRKFLVDTLGKGDFIGKFSQMRNRDFNCEVRAMTECKMLVLTPFKKELFENNSFSLYFYLRTTDRVYEMYKIAMMRMLFNYEEIMSYWMLTNADPEGVISIKPQEACLSMNMSERQYFYLLKKFKESNVITRDKSNIRITNRDSLLELSSNVRAFMDEGTQFV